MSKKFKIFTITAIAVALLLSAGALTVAIIGLTRSRSTISVQYGSDGNSYTFTDGSIAEVASRVSPSVVSITTETRTDSWFGGSTTEASAGTGIIVTADGYVLTNKHVVEGAKKINVVLDDGTTYNNVKVVETDPLSDVAYLKIKDVTDLPAATLGDSKTLVAGQPVLAIGNALGQYQNTVTSGIISGTGRSLTACSDDYCTTSESLSDMIQTDAAINPGNSGGPLINAAGEVIGINTATSTDADNLGFAIPISSVKGMLKSIIATGSAARAYAGVYSVDITPEIASEYDLPVTAGAYITSGSSTPAVVANGPAASAGIKDGDIVTRVNDIAIGSAGSIRSLIGEYSVGDTIQLTILRDGKEQKIDLTLGAYSADTTRSSKLNP